MKKIYKSLPLLAILTLVGCNNQSIHVEPKKGEKVEIQEMADALGATVANLNKQTAMSVSAKKINIDAKVHQYEINEEKNGLIEVADMKIKATEGTLNAGITGLNTPDAEIIASANLKAKANVSGKLMNEETQKLEDRKASGTVKVDSYLSKGDVYFYVDEKTGEFVNKVADMVGETVPVEFPAKYYLDLDADLSTFSLDYDAEDFLKEYGELTPEEKEDIVFQKYSETSFSIYGKHSETKEKKNDKYLIKTSVTDVEASLEFDIEKGLTRAAFIVTETETKYVYGELYSETDFDASKYEESFLNSVVETSVVKAQGEAGFKYGDDVKVTLPEDLDTYLPLMLFK